LNLRIKQEWEIIMETNMLSAAINKVKSSTKYDKIIVLTDCYVDIRNQILQNFPQFSDVIEDKNYFYKQRILKRYKNSV